MRSGTVNDEQRAGRVLRHARGDDLGVGDVDGARHVSCGERLGAAHVDQDEVRRVREPLLHVRAVGLEAEAVLEVRERARAVGSRHLGHETRHDSSVKRVDRGVQPAGRGVILAVAYMPMSVKIWPCVTE